MRSARDRTDAQATQNDAGRRRTTQQLDLKLVFQKPFKKAKQKESNNLSERKCAASIVLQRSAGVHRAIVFLRRRLEMHGFNWLQTAQDADSDADGL